ncbi:diacylglycerol acyltransferase [Aspergillus ambiguus]|uniref:diacylglycerol acyltransferase type 2A n=1 Tax=Aspergillus ambiguus TaxID=176160 RepID=UPI003CCD6F9E
MSQTRPSTNHSASTAPREVKKDKRRHGIRWAPLNIGLERRLQTLLVLAHTLTIALFLAFFFFTCAIPLTWPLLLPYLIYITLFSTAPTSGMLKGRSDFLRSLPIWKIYTAYFPAKLHRSEPLLPTRKYIFGYHPHGIISHGAFAAFATDALDFSKLFPGITNTLLTLDANFRIPFYREYAMAMGVASVSRESCENLLTKGGADGEGMGRAITIVIGGARESLDSLPHSLRLVLKRRKGFVKLAIRTGADLVPVLAFGENDLYEQVRSDEHPIIYKLQMLVKRLMGFTIPLFHARGIFNYDVGLMPYRRPLNIVVGRPIQVVRQQDRDKIDDDYIDRLHAEYVRELENLWDQWKDVFAQDRTSELEIVA